MKIIIRTMLLLALSSFFTAGMLQAQLCAGSLGDPVVNITFGQGSNPGLALAPGVTNYGYFLTSCPPDGFYNIGTSSLACFNDSWHTVNEDHTPGDGNGYMMIINASNSPGVFYVDTVQGLCGGTTYEFASWILNILKASSCNGNGNRPNVTFLIETISGQNLLTYKTGDIFSTTTPEWKQYGAFFKTPDAVSSVVIRMINNAPGGCGNDLLLDDITFRPCGAKVTGTIAGGTDIKDLCLGDTATVTMTATASQADANTFYQWQSTDTDTWSDIAGANSNTYTVKINANSIKTYLYRMAVAQGSNIVLVTCRILSNNILINVNPNPVPVAGNNSPKCIGETVTLSASNGDTYKWVGPNGFNTTGQSVSISPLQDVNAGKYYVQVTSAKGCVNSDSTIVTVRPKVIATASADVSICQGQSTQLNGTGGTFYSWSPIASLSAANIASPMATPDTTTTYLLVVSNGVCTAFDSVQVTVLKKPVAHAGPDVKMLQGNSASLKGIATGGNVRFFWTPAVFISNVNSLNPVVTPPRDTTYTLHVVSQNGCGSATDNVFVRVFKSIKIPNAFSPNNDGINDVWNIEALETYPDASVAVFNRYGQLIHTANGTSEPWMGTYNNKPLPVGTYYYIIDLKNGFAKISGSVLILR
ncbi:MAG: T9SS type B sorting domain-containing protein [Chitinophagaceae bacterium]|nr:T9SS type B sorting domain-containing protein [Chitinophagaceae bacterium]